MNTQQAYPKLAIVIVNWNKKEYVLRLLNSLRELTYPDYDIIVVDNASTDESVETIKQNFPNIDIIVNKENQGGTGGFNTGMRYALNKGEYKYIWLLDNDAEIEQNTLIELVKVMEKDDKIGIAGSRIIDKDSYITVECGAFIRKNTIGVDPYYRNLKTIPSYECIDVDYVAVCSAMVRTDALCFVGLMDERFFLFWDDMDWGWSFKDKGYRVVAVPNSIVFHPSFTERDRGILTNFYYGVRNSLLTYTKHLPISRIVKLFYNYCRYLCKGIIFLFFLDEKIKVITTLQSLEDFYKGRWGNFMKLHNSDKSFSIKSSPKREVDTNNIFHNKKRILFIGLNASKEEILQIRGKLYPYQSRITLLIQYDRYENYKDFFEKILISDPQKDTSLFYNIKLFIRLLLSGYDIAITPKPNPFLCCSKKRLLFKDEKFYDITTKVNIFVIFIISLIGELLAIPLTLLLTLKAMKWKRTYSSTICRDEKA